MHSPKKIAFWFLIASVVLSALLGILAILSDSFGWLEVRIVLTTVTISLASICALADAALWESKRGKALAAVGLALSLLAALMLIVAIWYEPSIEHKRFWRLTVHLVVLAVSTAHVCLLSLAKLKARYAWARVTAYVVIYSLAFLIILMFEFSIDSRAMFQAVGINSILVAAVSIIIPVLHRLSKADLKEESDKVSAGEGEQTWRQVICPKCGVEQFKALGEITCQDCQCKFIVKILDS
ncbi:MAG: hypothetical protein H7Y30_10315 [Pyrinomonadaceae bacterium]|nr:hypothetical protein [Pyrinomonadaceae bacterium]